MTNPALQKLNQDAIELVAMLDLLQREKSFSGTAFHDLITTHIQSMQSQAEQIENKAEVLG